MFRVTLLYAHICILKHVTNSAKQHVLGLFSCLKHANKGVFERKIARENAFKVRKLISLISLLALLAISSRLSVLGYGA